MTKPVRGRADFLDLGNWNAQCSMCGRKRKGGDLVRNWQGLWRCPEHNEQRQPQDFVRPVADNQLPPFVQTATYNFVYVCDPEGVTAIADYAVADCAIADFISPAFDPTVTD
jgi:hypothetical protein